MENFFQVYVHIPFCRRKCFYCAFNSKVGGAKEITNYVDALTKEIKNRAAYEKVGTIYFGGGTPSILQLDELKKIFCEIENNFDVDKSAEITIEVNPGTVDEKFLCGLKEIGFNRLSVGVQSFSDELLKNIGRIHNSKTAIQTVESAKKFFDNISLDLMYGLPNQTLEDLKISVELAASLQVEHISIYGLEIEEGTKFFELLADEKLNLPSDEICSDMYDFITEKLPALGYERYEISNFAKKNFESRHNLGYWRGRKYFGFGASAHSYDGNFRTSNICSVEDYIKKICAAEKISEVEEIVTRQAAMEEFCFLGLRTVKGISEKIFAEQFGENIFAVYGDVIKKYSALGLLKNLDGRIFLTEAGMKVSNIILADFLL